MGPHRIWQNRCISPSVVRQGVRQVASGTADETTPAMAANRNLHFLGVRSVGSGAR